MSLLTRIQETPLDLSYILSGGRQRKLAQIRPGTHSHPAKQEVGKDRRPGPTWRNCPLRSGRQPILLFLRWFPAVNSPGAATGPSHCCSRSTEWRWEWALAPPDLARKKKERPRPTIPLLAANASRASADPPVLFPPVRGTLWVEICYGEKRAHLAVPSRASFLLRPLLMVSKTGRRVVDACRTRAQP